MAANKTPGNKGKASSAQKQTVQIDEHPADRHFKLYAETHRDPVNKIIHYICIPLLTFGLFGLAWAIPFPHLGFLGVYGGYFNWASFLIAIAIYYYLKLSPVISYLILFILLGFSYGIMQLLSWQATGGFNMWLICLILFIVAFNALLAGSRRERAFGINRFNISSLAIAPAYFLHLLLNKAGIKH